MKVSIKKLLAKILSSFLITSETISTDIGNVQIDYCGKIVTVHLQGVGNGVTANKTLPLPKPKGGYVMTTLLYGTTIVADVEYYNGSWTFRRRSGSTPCYGYLTYIV